MISTRDSLAKGGVVMDDERCINWPCAGPAGHKGPCSSDDEAWEEYEEAGFMDLEDALDMSLDKAFGESKR